MSENMVERVARAIFEVEYPGGEADEYRWERSEDVYLAQARAAIQAMREPTEGMVKSAYDDSPYHAWRAMIDAALAEATKPFP